MKLLRPLHRQRTRRRNHFQVLGSDQLASHFGVAREHLEEELRALGVAFHKDSRGELWASIEMPR